MIRRWTLLSLVILILALGPWARASNMRSSAANDMHQIASAMMLYEENFKALPTDDICDSQANRC